MNNDYLVLPPLTGQPRTDLALTLLNSPRSYYRYKTFTATVGINPLVASASPLLTMASRLKTIDSSQNAASIYQDLVHEIKAFENLAQGQGYRSESILLARYVLCATLDELIYYSPGHNPNDWHNHKLLATFQKDSWGGERFFLILERLSADPISHIDLLELMYLCLSLGFMGKYRDVAQGELQLIEISEALYQCIRAHRGEYKKELIETTSAVKPPTQAVYKKPRPWLSFLVPLTLGGFLLIGIYIGFNYMITATTTPLLQELTKLSYANTQHH